MKVTIKWLKEYVDFDLSPQELGETLTMAGLEVESITHLTHDKIVSAKVESVRAHPNADRLSLCSVTDGGETHEIVCGATNMKTGDMVVLALPGAKLPQTAVFPDGITIKRSKIRGCESGGMLCSEQEIGLFSAKSDGIMILPDFIAAGTPLTEIPDFEDVVIEVVVTPNRPDCLSVIGIAREIAVATGGVLKIPPLLQKPGVDDTSSQAARDAVKVSLENEKGCLRYCCGIVDGVSVAESPLWLRARLSACGIRPVNNVVDVTNLVLLEFGQPLHAFDSDLVSDGLAVRNANTGESVTALDSQSYDLTPENLVIADSEGVLAIAGVMGAESSSVSVKTEKILLEAACFSPSSVRRTSKRLKLSSESSYRFERGVDPAAAIPALTRAASLIKSVAGGSRLRGVADVYPTEIKPCELRVSLEKIWKTLGTSRDRKEVLRLLASLGFEVSDPGDGDVSLKIPTFRADVTRPADVIEEVARLIGYNSIPKTEPSVGMLERKINGRTDGENLIKSVFVLNGFSEAVNYGFDNPEFLRVFNSGEMLEILNPISADISVMRGTLLAGLMRNLKFNLSRQCGAARIFESGRVFYPKGKGRLPVEEKVFSAVAAGDGLPDLWSGGSFDFFDMKGLFEKFLNIFSGGDDSFRSAVVFEPGSEKNYFHPGKSASIIFGDGIKLGYIGEIHPEAATVFDLKRPVALELNLGRLYSCRDGGGPVFSALPRFPSLRRDVAFIVKKNLEVGNIISGVKSVSPLIENVWIFDLFEDKSMGDDMKSVGISIVLRSAEKTLTDEEANSVWKKAVRTLGDSFGAQIR